MLIQAKDDEVNVISRVFQTNKEKGLTSNLNIYVTETINWACELNS